MSVSLTLQKSLIERSLDPVSGWSRLIVLCFGLLTVYWLLGGAPLRRGVEWPEASSVAVVEAAAESSTKAQDEEAVLEPAQVGVLDYLKRRYRVSPDALLPVFEIAEAVGRERRIDPMLILAVIGVESGFNPFAESAMGARGLMQVIPRFHQDKVPEGTSARAWFDPHINIRAGVGVLQEAIRRRGGLEAGLQHYAGSSDEEGAYASKVLAEKARLEKAALSARRTAIPGA